MNFGTTDDLIHGRRVYLDPTSQSRHSPSLYMLNRPTPKQRSLSRFAYTVTAGLLCLAMTGSAKSGSAAGIGACVPDESQPTRIELETSLGTVTIDLLAGTAPATVQNFMNYVSAGDYDGSFFHRSVPGFILQGGGFRFAAGQYTAIPKNPPVLNEPCLSNTRGTIAMAKLGGDPDSATNQWFINLANNAAILDAQNGGFTAFGRVVSGMNVLDAIAARPIVNGRLDLTTPLRSVFQSLPLTSAPVEDPVGYGCFSVDQINALMTTDGLFLENDPVDGGAFLLSLACDGIGATGPPSVICDPALGREVVAFDLATEQGFFPLLPMSCDAVAESEVSLQARRADLGPQIPSRLVEVLSVPEPETAALQTGALFALLAMGFRRRGFERLTF